MRFVIQIFVVFFIGMDHTFKRFEMISPWNQKGDATGDRGPGE